MNPVTTSRLAGLGRGWKQTALLLAAFAATTRAQPPAAPTRPPENPGEAIQLNPFEVQTSKDSSYGALNSNSITKFNTELDKMPISADIFTSTFMQDVDALGIEDMLTAYGAGAGTQWATPAFGSITNQPGDRVNVQQLGVRGVGAGGVRRNGFGFTSTNAIPTTTSSFDVERVEVLRGPQGLLYGASGAGGTIVATTKQAQFGRTNGSLSLRLNEFGSRRTLFDANTGNQRVAARVALLREINHYRRLYALDQTDGYYGQLAFRLPLNTTLRVEGQYSSFWATTGLAYAGVNLGGTAVDPRSGQQPGYLLFTNQTGAKNPATGAPYRYGALWNGHLDWTSYASYGQGLPKYKARTTNAIAEVHADTVWSKWLSTSIGGAFTRITNLNGSGPSAITAPLLSGNPFNDWAVSNSFTTNLIETRYKGFRAVALVSKDFGRVAKTQTAAGYSIDGRAIGATDYAFFLSDANGNLVTTPGTNNLGRTQMGPQWWSIGNGPGWNFNPPLGSTRYFSPQDGKSYAASIRNPRSPAWVTPTNPLGLASLFFPGTGISGNNTDGYAQRVWNTGYYASNLTNWWSDRFETLVGFRSTRVKFDYPNTSTSAPSPNLNRTYRANSYNLGVNGRVTSWLRWFLSTSSTFDIPYNATSNDPYGNPPGTTKGSGQEIGFKFSPLDKRVSGSITYYRTTDRGQIVGSQVANIVNPSGLNGVYNGVAGKGSSDALDYKADGVELILTAAPTRHWRMRFSATRSNGRIETTKIYGILYNDQFYTDGKGNVTYKDGSPFLVPTDPAAVSKLNASTNPATLSGATQPLTTAMIGNPASAYYAWQGAAVSTSGNIAASSNLGRVLRFFNKPGVGTALTGATGLPISQIQYAWPDPANYGGSAISVLAGQSTVGYPVYRISLTNSYEFDQGWLKGFGFAFTANNAWQWRTYYYNNPDKTRPLYSQPDTGWQVNLNPYYEHRFRRITWRTQVNISNLTNHYVLSLAPNDGLGFTNPNNITVQWNGQPRAFAWTNTFSF